MIVWNVDIRKPWLDDCIVFIDALLSVTIDSSLVGWLYILVAWMSHISLLWEVEVIGIDRFVQILMHIIIIAQLVVIHSGERRLLLLLSHGVHLHELLLLVHHLHLLHLVVHHMSLSQHVRVVLELGRLLSEVTLHLRHHILLVGVSVKALRLVDGSSRVEVELSLVHLVQLIDVEFLVLLEKFGIIVWRDKLFLTKLMSSIIIADFSW